MTISQQLSKFKTKVEKQLKEAISKKTMLEIAQVVMQRIKERTRKGFGVRKNNQEYKFPALSLNYIKARRRRRLSPFTKPTKSNVTLTGRLVASLRYKAKDGNLTIEPTGQNKGLTNQRLAQILEQDLDRRWIALSKKDQDKVISIIKRRLKKQR